MSEVTFPVFVKSANVWKLPREFFLFQNDMCEVKKIQFFFFGEYYVFVEPPKIAPISVCAVYNGGST